jgi:hypothetical protein
VLEPVALGARLDSGQFFQNHKFFAIAISSPQTSWFGTPVRVLNDQTVGHESLKTLENSGFASRHRDGQPLAFRRFEIDYHHAHVVRTEDGDFVLIAHRRKYSLREGTVCPTTRHICVPEHEQSLNGFVPALSTISLREIWIASCLCDDAGLVCAAFLHC